MVGGNYSSPRAHIIKKVPGWARIQILGVKRRLHITDAFHHLASSSLKEIKQYGHPQNLHARHLHTTYSFRRHWDNDIQLLRFKPVYMDILKTSMPRAKEVSRSENPANREKSGLFR